MSALIGILSLIWATYEIYKWFKRMKGKSLKEKLKDLFCW